LAVGWWNGTPYAAGSHDHDDDGRRPRVSRNNNVYCNPDSNMTNRAVHERYGPFLMRALTTVDGTQKGVVRCQRTDIGCWELWSERRCIQRSGHDGTGYRYLLLVPKG
jgi:hypothetical protein